VVALEKVLRSTTIRGGALAGVLLLAAACSSAAKTASSSTSTAAPAAAGKVVVQVRHGTYGSYLTDGSGRSLYEFASDSKGKSTCTGTCLTYWPALAASGTPTAGTGATASLLATFIRGDGTSQVSYAGHPLYYFAQDQAAGATSGQGSSAFGARWWLLAPAGTPITSGASGGTVPSSPASTSTAPSSSAPTSSGGGGYGGGGYGHG